MTSNPTKPSRAETSDAHAHGDVDGGSGGSLDDRSSKATATAPLLTRAFRALTGFLMPQACVHCRREGDLICDPCQRSMEPIAGPRCQSCGEPTTESRSRCNTCVAQPPALDRLAPVYRYDGAARSAVLALKFRALRAIAPLMARPMAAHPLLARAAIDCIVPVPAHAKRVRERGYNQAAVLARQLARSTGIPLLSDGIAKTVHTPSQVDLSRHERAESVQGVFAARYDFADAHLLLIDDVATTASTLISCAGALKQANARRVTAMTFAKETSGSGQDHGI